LRLAGHGDADHTINHPLNMSLLLHQRLAFDCKNSPWSIYHRISDLY